jgi:hypothetical protein
MTKSWIYEAAANKYLSKNKRFVNFQCSDLYLKFGNQRDYVLYFGKKYLGE